MKNFKERRASLLRVIQALDDTDFVDGEDVELDTLDEQLPEELNDEDLETLSDDELEDAPAADEEFEDVELPEDQDDDAILSDDEEELVADDGDDELDFLNDDEDDVTASETADGIEDDIGDEVNGGDPSVSEVAEGGDEVNVSTTGEVFPTESEYVARITARLDKVATVLEKRGMKRMAFRIDKLSDQLEASLKK